MQYNEDIENFVKSTDNIFTYYKTMRKNPEELKNLYKEYPFFFTCLWFYLKDINETPGFYVDCGLIVYKEIEYTPLSKYMYVYVKNFLEIKIDNEFDPNHQYDLTDEEKDKCSDFYRYVLKKDIDKLNKFLKCFRPYIRDYEDDASYLLYIDQFFSTYIITPIFSGNYDEFFENLYKQALMRYQLGGKK